MSSIFHVGDNVSDQRERGFLSFDTDGLTNAAIAVRARLQVLQQNSVDNPFATQGGLGLLGGDFQASAMVGSASSFGTTLLTNGHWYLSGFTARALSAINKTGTTQFRLRFASETYNEAYEFVSFFSDNAGTVPEWPALVLYVNP